MTPQPVADLGLGIGNFASAVKSPPEDGYGGYSGGSVPTDTTPHPQACTLLKYRRQHPYECCSECQRDRNGTASPGHSSVHILYSRQHVMGEGECSEGADSALAVMVPVWDHHPLLALKQGGAVDTGHRGPGAEDGSAGSPVPPHGAADSCGRGGSWRQRYPRPHTHCTPSGCRCFAPAVD